MAVLSLRRRPRELPLPRSPHRLRPMISSANVAASTFNVSSSPHSSTSTTTLCRRNFTSRVPGHAAGRAWRSASPEVDRCGNSHSSSSSIPATASMLALRTSYRPVVHAPSSRSFRSTRIVSAVSGHSRQRHEQYRSRDPQVGLTTPVPDDARGTRSKSPFYFEAGYAGWAKRPSRPFPPPFFSPPSGSFSDPLSTHNRASDRRPQVNGQLIRGVTNGDDALLVSDNLIGTNDGVGAWAQREKGHAPLWSRLLMHFWVMAAEANEYGGEGGTPDPVKYLDEAYTQTKEALSAPNGWLGTTTACSALLHFSTNGAPRPVLYVTQLGDCKCLVLRPSDRSVIFSTDEQWHYFDCPRQLGTNSPDTPLDNAVMSKIDIQEDDMVLAMSDGVTDNLWEGEITDTVVDAMNTWQEMNRKGEAGPDVGEGGSYAEGMRYVAQELVLAARKIAEDPFAASPFMERGVDEGLAIEGGKLDDISVVAALCKKRKG